MFAVPKMVARLMKFRNVAAILVPVALLAACAQPAPPPPAPTYVAPPAPAPVPAARG